MADDKDQDALAEEWANALMKEEGGAEAPAAEVAEAAAGGSSDDALADEWAKALATQEVDGVKKEKEQTYLRTQTHEPEFKDMTAEHKAQRQNPGTKRDLDFILDIPLEVSAELGRTKLLINELLQLGQGSVIELNKLAGEPMEIFVNGKLVARGEAVVINEKFGIRLTDIISPIERVKQLA
ncbi:MAG: flagellar motor switch protein FliN [Deltaproteobacteria bacterium HGW-Deltaproteobacteria-8]|jgi:flagellar motor switch protein FliN/FliY|nr:MAG: flagellar motor switch protein FliN [Deltaproteobacteria bacterium HGW-Deltaproteobacteria-8]